MTKSKNQHVVPYSGQGRAVKKSWSNKATKTFSSQKDAVHYAKDIAKKNHSEMYVHSKTWRIRDRTSYKN